MFYVCVWLYWCMNSASTFATENFSACECLTLPVRLRIKCLLACWTIYVCVCVCQECTLQLKSVCAHAQCSGPGCLPSSVYARLADLLRAPELIT